MIDERTATANAALADAPIHDDARAALRELAARVVDRAS